MPKTSSSAKPQREDRMSDPSDVAALAAGVDPEQRYQYVAVAAYFIAQRRGFENGHPDEDWVEAELEIDRLIAEGHLLAASYSRDDA
jgi:hypothetical protein